jgi:internalin A
MESARQSAVSEKPPFTIFISYSHKNEKQKLTLERYLNEFLISKSGLYVRLTSDTNLAWGDTWRQRLEKMWSEVDVFLVLVSKDYLESTTKDPELEVILAKGQGNQARVLPIILEDCPWQKTPIAQFQALLPFAKARNSQEPYTEIGQALLSIISLWQNTTALDILQQAKRAKTPVLRLSKCQLEVIPRDLLEMTWLRELYLDNNEIRVIENLENLKSLEILSLADNKITHLGNLQELTKLTYLDLQGNAIKQLQGLEGNRKLQTLGLSSNGLQELSGLEHLQDLRTLFVAHNELRQVEVLEHLLKLKRILLTNNKIKSIRPLLEHLRKGLEVKTGYSFEKTDQGVYLEGNSLLAEPSVEVIARGREAVIKYFEDADAYGLKKLEIVKLILVGNSGVGKTNFSQFLRRKRLTRAHNSTHLLNIQGFDAPFLRSESDNPMRINIFDFGGQDYYHDSHRLYYSHDTMYVLLWDAATNRHSVEQDALAAGDTVASTYDNFPLEYWLESIKYNLRDKSRPTYGSPAPPAVPSLTPPTAPPAAPVAASRSISAPIFVLQNKVDLAEGPLNQGTLLRDYPNIVGFFNTSLQAKKRTKVLLEVLSEYMNKLDFSGRQLIKFEYKIIQHFLKGNQESRAMSLPEFQQQCVNIIDDPTVNFTSTNTQIIAQILNSLGMVFYDEGPQDEGTVFTRIDELNNSIKEVMAVAKQSNDKGNDKGFFKRSQVTGIANAENVLQLLLRNNSIVSLSANDFLAPQFLPQKPEEGIAFFLNAFAYCNMRFVYKAYFHKSLLLNLFAEYLKNDVEPDGAGSSQSFRYWRNGIIISKGTGTAKQMVLVEFKKEANRGVVYLKTRAPFNKNGLEREVERTLEKLNQGWTVDKELSVDSATFFTMQELEEGIKNRIFEFSGGETLEKPDGEVVPVIQGQKEVAKVFNIHQFKQIVDFKQAPKKLFISYSSRNAEFVRRFATHLEVLKAKGYIDPWYDRMIEPGTKWDDAIREEMAKSDVVIFLLSPDFLATQYIMKTEVPQALRRFKDAAAELFFIELQPCSWQLTDIAEYQQTGKVAVTDKNIISIGTPTNDEKWNDVIAELMKKLKAMPGLLSSGEDATETANVEAPAPTE